MRGWKTVHKQHPAVVDGLCRLHDGDVDKHGQNHPHVGWICCECVVTGALKVGVLRVTAVTWSNRPGLTKYYGGSKEK
jgi:hypothetical protein